MEDTLQQVRDALAEGKEKEAVKQARRLRSSAARHGDLDTLLTLRELAAEQSGGERPGDWKQLGDAVSWSIAHVERTADAPPPVSPSRCQRVAGVTLFLVVTACWMVGLVLLPGRSGLLLIAAIFSAMSVVVTGYLLGRIGAGFLLGCVPGATAVAIGFWSSPAPPGVNPGHELGDQDALWLLGVLLLTFGWALYFFPLMAAGVELRRRRERRLSAAPPPDST